MVYVYVKKSKLDKYIGSSLSLDEIEETLKDLGMDIKGISEEDDPEIKVEVTAEKLELVSAVGLGRAIKYYRGLERDIKKYEIKRGDNVLTIKKNAKESRPKAVAAILRDVNLDEDFLKEMIAIQEKIHESHGRNRKKAAIGIYPMDKFEFPLTYGSENPENIRYIPLESDEVMNGYEILEKHPTGKKYKHLLEKYEKYPVFRDKNGKILSMPPIVNSNETGKVELHHKDLFIECSGYNLKHLDNIMKVLVTTFIDMGAKAESVKVVYEDTNEVYELNLDMYKETINLDFINKLIGLNLDINDVEKYFNKMIYEVEEIKDKDITVKIPPFRSDIWSDVDIADDIARAYGYNNIELRFPNISSVGSKLDFSYFKDSIIDLLTNLGFLQIYSFILTSTENQFRRVYLNEEDFDYIRLNNTEDEGINMCRINLFPESLLALSYNKRHKYPQKIFESGFVIIPDVSKDTKARDDFRLAVSIVDNKSNYTEIKGILDFLMKSLNIKSEVRVSNLPYLINGRQGEIFIENEKIGFIGEVHPKILKNYNLLVPVSMFEIDLEKIYDIVNKD